MALILDEPFERGIDVIAERQRQLRSRRDGSRNAGQADDREERAGDLLRGGASGQGALDRKLIRRLGTIDRDRGTEAHESVDLVLETRRLSIRLARKDGGDQHLVTEGELAQAIRVVIHNRTTIESLLGSGRIVPLG
jgi:hypothetical protein